MTWREFRSLLYGLPSTSRTWGWLQQQNTTASRQQDVLNTPDDVAHFLGFDPELQDA